MLPLPIGVVVPSGVALGTGAFLRPYVGCVVAAAVMAAGTSLAAAPASLVTTSRGCRALPLALGVVVLSGDALGAGAFLPPYIDYVDAAAVMAAVSPAWSHPPRPCCPLKGARCCSMRC